MIALINRRNRVKRSFCFPPRTRHYGLSISPLKLSEMTAWFSFLIYQGNLMLKNMAQLIHWNLDINDETESPNLGVKPAADIFRTEKLLTISSARLLRPSNAIDI